MSVDKYKKKDSICVVLRGHKTNIWRTTVLCFEVLNFCCTTYSIPFCMHTKATEKD